MTKGYLLFAQDNQEVSYSKLATACALSIKLTQPDGYNSVAVATNNFGYFDRTLFDHIIPTGALSGMDARSRAYDLSPYDETVLLDSDMLLLKPMDYCWDLLASECLFISCAPQNYKGMPFQYGYYRRLFEHNQWPNVYSAFTYFKKSAVASEFFNLVKLLTDNAEVIVDSIMPNSGLDYVPTDEAFAIALSILDIEDQVVHPNWDFPRITHMKPAVQQWNVVPGDWHEKLRFSLDAYGKVKLGVWEQEELLHYVKKELITDSVIQTLR